MLRPPRHALAMPLGVLAALLAVGGCSSSEVTGAPTASSSRSPGATPSSSPPTSASPSPTPTGTGSAPSPVPQPSGSAPAPGGDGGAPPAPVDVVVTFAGWNATSGDVEVGGYANGVVEVDGMCTVRLTSGQTVVEATSAAFPDAASTSCGAVAVPGSQVTSGTWVALLSYASSTSAGTSVANEVTIP